MKLFGEAHHWLVIGSNLTDCLETLEDSAFGMSTDFLIAIYSEENYLLYDVYSPGKKIGGTLKVSLIGDWSASAGLNFYSSTEKSIRWNLMGLALKARGLVCLMHDKFSDQTEGTNFQNRMSENISLTNNISQVHHQAPHMKTHEHLTDYTSKTTDPASKLAYALLLQMSEFFNFTLVFRIASNLAIILRFICRLSYRIDYLPHQIWKKGDKAGPVMNSLASGEIDITGTAATLTPVRLDIAVPVYPAVPYR